MNVFNSNSRIEITNEGVLFYERDAIFSKYIFSGDLIMDIEIDYLYPGFGIIISENDGGEPEESGRMHLFKFGNNSFEVYDKEVVETKLNKEASCIFAPREDFTSQHLIMEITLNRKIVIYHIEEDGGRRELGSYTLPRKINEYYIGFYSNVGNRIKDINFLTKIPDLWKYNISNVKDGRIRFIDNGFIFENCLHYAEVEQDNVFLKAGTYYINYEKTGDIKCYVFPTYHDKKDKDFEDEQKNILKNGKIVLDRDIEVCIKFVGKNGSVSRIVIMSNSNGDYVETNDKPEFQDGSYITVYLKDIAQVKWSGTIESFPSWNDHSKECPYAIFETDKQKIEAVSLGVKENKEYDYVFDVKDMILTKEESGYKMNKNIVADSMESINIFRNVKGHIDKLILVKEDGEEIDTLLQRIFRKFVPAEIISPIIVSDYDSNESLDISSSYREVVIDTIKIESFPADNDIIKLSYLPADDNIKVYGIPAGAIISHSQDNINDYASIYEKISLADCTIKKQEISIREYIKQKYKYIAIEYNSSEEYEYVFTNYEREIFSSDEIIFLNKPVLNTNESIIVYGYKGEIKKDYIYRIPSEAMINSVDLCCSDYDTIPGSLYKINYVTGVITIHDSIIKDYDGYIIDYLKADSYAINYSESTHSYAVDIVLTGDKGKLYYGMDDDGNISSVKLTGIKPDKSKFIIIKRKEDEVGW